MLLIMIFSACRLAELGRMERPDLPEEPTDSVVLHTVTKQFQESKRNIVIRRLSRPALCPVAALWAWTMAVPPDGDGRLFHSLTGDSPERMAPTTRKELTTPAICTQFLAVMAEAGIPSHYKAYSVKHAVVTKLFRMGATEEQVNAYGGWAMGSSTARRWYNIATLEEDWLGAKLVGEWFGANPNSTLEDFVAEHLPTTSTEQQAATRSEALEALIKPLYPPEELSAAKNRDKK
jgi:integrase